MDFFFISQRGSHQKYRKIGNPTLTVIIPNNPSRLQRNPIWNFQINFAPIRTLWGWFQNKKALIALIIRARIWAMLSNINRLRKSNEIQKVFKFGKSIRSANFSLRYNPNRASNNRFAIVVGLKVSKLATRRNAIKRLVREVIRINLPSIPTSFDIVLTAHKLANWPIKLADVQLELTELLKKIR